MLREEGVKVIEHPGLHGETTIIAPDSMPEFAELLLKVDRDYKPPDKPAGDAELFGQLDHLPEVDDEPMSPPLTSTTEHAESMMSEMLSSMLSLDRRGR